MKSAYTGLGLRMPCCGVPAIPKTSSRGNHFFSHARKGECATADESAEHLYCKSLVAKAAYEAGWQVTTERPGATPGGEAWVADVFCEMGRARIAFEIQMSPQADDETLRRQQRYKASGVRGAWFFGSRGRRASLEFDRETPAFSLLPVKVGAEAIVDGFGVALGDFVQAMLQRKLSWTIPKISRPHYVEYFEQLCWQCRRPSKQVIGHLHGDEAPAAGFASLEDFNEGQWEAPYYTVAQLSDFLEAAHRSVSNDDLRACGLNTIGRREIINGKRTNYPYCNVCLHCGVSQNNHFFGEALRAAMNGKGQVSGDNGNSAIDSQDDRLAEDAGSFGLAVIPREVEGKPRWILSTSGVLSPSE